MTKKEIEKIVDLGLTKILAYGPSRKKEGTEPKAVKKTQKPLASKKSKK